MAGKAKSKAGAGKATAQTPIRRQALNASEKFVLGIVLDAAQRDKGGFGTALRNALSR